MAAICNILAIEAKNAEALSTIGDALSTVKPVKDSTSVPNSVSIASNQIDPNCLDDASTDAGGSSIDVGSRNIPIILDDNESESNRGREDRYNGHSMGILASGPQIKSSSLLMAEAMEGDHLPASIQITHPLEPPAVIPEDDQYIVERLLRRKVVSRGRGRCRRRITQYFVKWQGYPGEENTWVDEDDIHEDLVTAYNCT